MYLKRLNGNGYIATNNYNIFKFNSYTSSKNYQKLFACLAFLFRSRILSFTDFVPSNYVATILLLLLL